MRYDERQARLGRVVRLDAGRALDRQPGAAEHEQVEVELARAPAAACAAPERPLEALQRGQQCRRAGLWRGARRDVERDDGIVEVRLVGDADRPRNVEARNATQPRPGQRGERANRRAERRARVADVAAEADVRPDPPRQGRSSTLARLGR
jgi:hypothetical protein